MSLAIRNANVIANHRNSGKAICRSNLLRDEHERLGNLNALSVVIQSEVDFSETQVEMEGGSFSYAGASFLTLWCAVACGAVIACALGYLSSLSQTSISAVAFSSNGTVSGIYILMPYGPICQCVGSSAVVFAVAAGIWNYISLQDHGLRRIRDTQWLCNAVVRASADGPNIASIIVLSVISGCSSIVFGPLIAGSIFVSGLPVLAWLCYGVRLLGISIHRISHWMAFDKSFCLNLSFISGGASVLTAYGVSICTISILFMALKSIDGGVIAPAVGISIAGLILSVASSVQQSDVPLPGISYESHGWYSSFPVNGFYMAYQSIAGSVAHLATRHCVSSAISLAVSIAIAAQSPAMNITPSELISVSFILVSVSAIVNTLGVLFLTPSSSKTDGGVPLNTVLVRVVIIDLLCALFTWIFTSAMLWSNISSGAAIGLSTVVLLGSFLPSIILIVCLVQEWEGVAHGFGRSAVSSAVTMLALIICLYGAYSLSGYQGIAILALSTCARSTFHSSVGLGAAIASDGARLVFKFFQKNVVDDDVCSKRREMVKALASRTRPAASITAGVTSIFTAAALTVYVSLHTGPEVAKTTTAGLASNSGYYTMQGLLVGALLPLAVASAVLGGNSYLSARREGKSSSPVEGVNFPATHIRPLRAFSTAMARLSSDISLVIAVPIILLPILLREIPSGGSTASDVAALAAFAAFALPPALMSSDSTARVAQSVGGVVAQSAESALVFDALTIGLRFTLPKGGVVVFCVGFLAAIFSVLLLKFARNHWDYLSQRAGVMDSYVKSYTGAAKQTVGLDSAPRMSGGRTFKEINKRLAIADNDDSLIRNSIRR